MFWPGDEMGWTALNNESLLRYSLQKLIVKLPEKWSWNKNEYASLWRLP